MGQTRPDAPGTIPRFSPGHGRTAARDAARTAKNRARAHFRTARLVVETDGARKPPARRKAGLVLARTFRDERRESQGCLSDVAPESDPAPERSGELA